MIRKLKIKFILLAMISLGVLLALIVTGMNVINYNSVLADVDSTLSLLSRNKGSFPDIKTGLPSRLPPHMSPELPYESRYFSVLLNSNGEVILTETGKIISVDSALAASYAKRAFSGVRERGFTDEYRYLKSDENGNTRIVFIDCGRKLDAFRSFLYASVIMSLAGFAVVFFIILSFADRYTRPIAESYEKQKRFITDAGHEIKTPLTVINANIDILEAEGGNECLDDIRTQTARLTALTNALVALARMEESDNAIQRMDFPVSDVVSDTALSFNAPAQSQKKNIICNIQPDLTLYGDCNAVSQLISILMDNALKYSPEGSTVYVNMGRYSKNICISVTNSTSSDMTEAELSRVFDRFYRTDSSRSSETGGQGIGLSLAKAIVTAHGGKILALMPEKGHFQIKIIL